jgi:hypothetical protein
MLDLLGKVAGACEMCMQVCAHGRVCFVFVHINIYIYIYIYIYRFSYDTCILQPVHAFSCMQVFAHVYTYAHADHTNM